MEVAVLGAGTIGRTIAHVCARSGYDVRVHSHDATIVMDSIDVIERQLDDAYTSGELDEERRERTLDRLEATTDIEAAVSDSDVTIETTVEDAGRLQQRFAKIEDLVGREALVTSAIPSLSITAGAAGLRHPDRALGLHFSRPIERPLVEIILADQTGDGALQSARAFVDGLSATSVTIRDRPGVASTRLSLALEVEAMRMVGDGVASVEAIDRVFAHEHDTDEGPLERADRAGLDSRLDTLEYLADTLGSRFEPPPVLRDLASNGKTGVDAGEGFYVWEGDDPAEGAIPDPATPDRDDEHDGPGKPGP